MPVHGLLNVAYIPLTSLPIITKSVASDTIVAGTPANVVKHGISWPCKIMILFNA